MSDNMSTETNPIKRFFSLEPAIVRGVLVALVAILVKVFGVTVINNDEVDLVIDLFTSISAFIAVWWTRGVVIPTAKVFAFRTAAGNVMPGDAIVSSQREMRDVIASSEIDSEGKAA